MISHNAVWITSVLPTIGSESSGVTTTLTDIASQIELHCLECGQSWTIATQGRLNLIRPEFAPRRETHFFCNSASQFSTRVMATFG